jgi:hypothetical protein
MSDNTNDPHSSSAPADDVLWGTPAIADFIGKSLSETQYLIRTGALPVGRLGPKTIFSSKRQLRRRLTPKTAAAE